MNLNDASDMAAGIPGYGRINLHEEQYKRWDEFIDKTCIKRLDGLYKLLAINSFQAADYWLLGFHRPGAHVDVIRLCNQRLVDLVTQREWNNVVSLLEVMKKNKVAVDKYMLARDPDLVKVLVNEGPIVSDKTERRQLEFMLGMRSSGYEVSNRLASIPANEIRLDRLLNKFARREAAKDWQRRETVTEWPISSDKVKDVVNEIGIFYIREYVRTVVEQVESTLNANGQEFTPAVKMRINEAINQGSLAMSMRDYLVTVINDELEHGPTSRLSMIQRRSGESNRETVRHFMAHSSPEEVINFLDRAEESYRDEIEWSSLPEFGGKKWADVVKWTKKLIIAQTTNNDHALRHAMDTIFSLEHNTASVLNKDYEGYFIGRLDNIKPLLDAKFKSVNLAQDVRLIFQYVSMSTADKMMQILAVLQDLPGYDFANHRINPYANWRTVRGAKPQGD
jgi:hypothetical protein